MANLDNDYIHLIVEISVTVYVFLLGLPILVNQIFLPDDLRRMSKKNYNGNVSLQICVLTVFLLAILVVAYLANVSPTTKNIDAKETIVTILFCIMLILTIGFLFVNMIKSQGYRAKITQIIKNRIIRSIKKNGKLDQAFFEDLEYMGIYSKGGAETRNVIEALEEILAHVITKADDTFDSDGLISIIETLCIAITNSVEPGSKNNMIEVLTIYKDMLMQLSNYNTPENQLFYGNETRKIKDSTTKIALAALKKDYADMMPLVLNVLTLIPRSSDKLFDIGLLALGRGQYQIATNVLAEIMDRDNKDYLTMNNYLGLAAHFYMSGSSARQYALRSLQTNKVKVTPEDARNAKEYHYIMSNFITVDHLEEFFKGL
ncbi:MAG: hypothetical protein R2828_17035 [Saprospiraceae bacterium]